MIVEIKGVHTDSELFKRLNATFDSHVPPEICQIFGNSVTVVAASYSLETAEVFHLAERTEKHYPIHTPSGANIANFKITIS